MLVRKNKLKLLSARRIAVALPLVIALATPHLATIAGALVVAASLAIFSDARAATFAHGPWLRSVGIGVLCGVAIALIVAFGLDQLIATLMGAEPDLSSFDRVKGSTSQFLLLLLIGIIWGGVVEETIFRGFVIGWGCSLFGARAQLSLTLVSAAVFGFAHLYQGWSGVITTGILGLGYGLAYIATGRNLLTAIAMHATVNVFGVTELYLGL